MTVFASLPAAEQARQLANPEGQVGIEVAQWLHGNNRDGNAKCIALLALRPGNRVLEIGFGNGRAAADIVSCAENVQYDGIDISPTMVDEARRFNAALLDESEVHSYAGCFANLDRCSTLFEFADELWIKVAEALDLSPGKSPVGPRSDAAESEAAVQFRGCCFVEVRAARHPVRHEYNLMVGNGSNRTA